MRSNGEVQNDLAEFRADLAEQRSPYVGLLAKSPITPLIDIGVDWMIVMVAVWLCFVGPSWLLLVGILIVGNRQRALGNILHDAGHGNLSQRRTVNDLIAHSLVAPLLFSSLRAYRDSHFRHHQGLGDPATDPDVIAPRSGERSWLGAYLTNLLEARSWMGSLLGDLRSGAVKPEEKVFILGWWCAVMACLVALFGPEFAVFFLLLWLGARATSFHAITTFREMCDHVGLRPGGIFSYTRDVTATGPMRWLVHPRNNGYHLTHHLMPAVPYYRLPMAHRMFREMPTFKLRGLVCPAYVATGRGVVTAWSTGGES